MFAYPGMAAPERLRGRYIGAAHAMFGLGLTVGPIIGVAVFTQIGSTVWLWCGATGLVGVVLAWFGMRVVPPRAADTPEPATAADPDHDSPATAAVDAATPDGHSPALAGAAGPAEPSGTDKAR